MIVQEKTAKVWHIKNNELCCKNKKISTINYNDIEIAILNEERECFVQEFLIKDQNNEYWKLGIAPIKFQLFTQDLDETEKVRAEEYCNDITNAYKKIDLKAFWERKMGQNKYFNKCELEYIHRHFPDIYSKPKESRKIFEENRDKLQEQEKIEREQRDLEKIKTTNDKFNKALKEMKYKIFIGEMISVEDLEFYKDNKISGRTIQNNILYLAKHYGIEIPLATQGFINRRLVSYNFKTGDFFYKTTDSNKSYSTKMQIYLQQILEKVQEEFKEKFKNKKLAEIIMER